MSSGGQDRLQAARPTALVILVGLTAGRSQRLHLASYFRAQGDHEVYLPVLPYALGLHLCSIWLGHFLTSRVFIQKFRAVHFLNFIGGGYVFRFLSEDLKGRPIGRVVYVRSPIQEEVPRMLAKRFTRTGVMLLRGKGLADLSAGWIRALPFPAVNGEQGLIIETGTSKAAMNLGIGRQTPAAAEWAHDALLPGAADVIELPVSHDEVYDSEEVLSQVAHFMNRGRFMGRQGPRTEAGRGGD